MQFHAKYQDNSWCPNGARSEKTMLHRVMDTNNKIRKKPVFTGFLRTIYAALCGNIRGFSRFTPLEIVLSRDRHVGSNPTVSASRLNLHTITHQSCNWCVFLYLDNVDIPMYIKRLPVAAFFISWVDPHHLRHQTKSRRIFYFSSASFSL